MSGPAPCYPESGCDRSDGKYRAAEGAPEPILCAESLKMKTALAMNEIDLCKLLEVNDSAQHGARRGKSGAGAEGKAGVYLQ